MGSATDGLKLSKIVKSLEHFKDLIKQKKLPDDYTRGVYNGVEYCLSLLANKDPNYLEEKVNESK